MKKNSRSFLESFEVTAYSDDEYDYNVYTYNSMVIAERLAKGDDIGLSREVKFIPDIDIGYSVDVISAEAASEIAKVINQHSKFD